MNTYDLTYCLVAIAGLIVALNVIHNEIVNTKRK